MNMKSSADLDMCEDAKKCDKLHSPNEGELLLPRWTALKGELSKEIKKRLFRSSFSVVFSFKI